MNVLQRFTICATFGVFLSGCEAKVSTIEAQATQSRFQDCLAERHRRLGVRSYEVCKRSVNDSVDNAPGYLVVAGYPLHTVRVVSSTKENLR